MSPTVRPEPCEILRGFISFKTLATALDLDLFTRVEDGSANLERIAAELGICERPASVLLTACVAMGLLNVKDGVYRNAPTASEFLVNGSPTTSAQSSGCTIRGYISLSTVSLKPYGRTGRRFPPTTHDLFDVVAADPGRQRDRGQS